MHWQLMTVANCVTCTAPCLMVIKGADRWRSQKMMKLQEDSYLEFAKSVAIRMFPTSSTLGIAEGIETALACHQITKCNTWATMNTAFMKKFRVPAGVKNLIILQTQMQTLLGMPPLLNALRRICTRRMIWKVSPCAGLRRVILMICCLTVQKYSSGYFTGG